MSKKTKPGVPTPGYESKSKRNAMEEITLSWNLLDLPTAQHKAGLAGLVLAIKSLSERSANDPDSIPPTTVPEFASPPTALHVSVRFTVASLNGLIADLYDVDVSEAEATEEKKKRSKGTVIVEPLRTSKRTELALSGKDKGKAKEIEEYFYLRFRCRLSALRDHFPIPQWLKLWQDFIHSIIRDNTKDGPYRAAALRRVTGSEWEACAKRQWSKIGGDGAETTEEGLTVDRLHLSVTSGLDEPISGSLLIGAQGRNAENLEYRGKPHLNLLLQFWHLVMMVFVPTAVDSEGKQHLGKRTDKDKSQHYVVAIPEVADVAEFVRLFSRGVAKLNKDLVAYRPAQSVVVVPAQASLEFINSVSAITENVSHEKLVRAIHAVEFFHLARPEPTKAAVIIGNGKAVFQEDLLELYRDIVGRNGQRPYRNPLFKLALIQALLRGKPWWGELQPLFMTRDWRFFVNASDTPTEAPDIAKLPWFWADVRGRLNVDQNLYEDRKASTMADQKAESRPLQLLVNHLVRNYVRKRAQARSQIDLPEKIDWETVDPKYKEEQSKVAQSLFLEFRSRRDQAFADHFSQTFFGAKQYLSDDDQHTLAEALIVHRRIEDVKILTLMALSANS